MFNGHIHNYERFERHGVEYVITGGGGAEPYPLLFRGHADLYQDTGFPVYHYLTLEVSNHKLHAVMWKVKDPDARHALGGDRRTSSRSRQPDRQKPNGDSAMIHIMP